MNGNLALGIVGGCVRRHNAAVCVLCAMNIVRIIATERLVKFRISTSTLNNACIVQYPHMQWLSCPYPNIEVLIESYKHRSLASEIVLHHEDMYIGLCHKRLLTRHNQESRAMVECSRVQCSQVEASRVMVE